MSIRVFLFCDYCNPSAIRTIEERRSSARPFGACGRRSSDGRSWFDGRREEAQAVGWRVDEEGRDICPQCLSRGLGAFRITDPGA